ncbi:MAG TPA: hypothetical protein VJT09_16880 [Pyrinomonadaceae bacterium]|nr:hypothetical protein [Pyrinomonadaceae bacterium]
MKRCPACQRTYTDDTLTYCLEDGSALLSAGAATSASDLPATLIMQDPRATVREQQETSRPAPTPVTAPPPAWSPAQAHLSPPVPTVAARAGRGAAITSLILAIAAFVLLGFCILGGATGVNNDLLGGIFIFSILLGLAGAVLGIIATSRSSKDASTQSSRMMAIIALVLNGLYLLITIVILILAAVMQGQH